METRVGRREDERAVTHRDGARAFIVESDARAARVVLVGVVHCRSAMTVSATRDTRTDSAGGRSVSSRDAGGS